MDKKQGLPVQPPGAPQNSNSVSNQDAGKISDEPLVIDQPALQNPLSRLMELIASFAIWALFIYLCDILGTIIAWFLGYQIIFIHAFSAGVIESTKSVLIFLGIFSLLSFGILFAWAQWNYWRFGRLERRKPRPGMADDEIVALFGLSLEKFNMMRVSKISRIVPLYEGLDIEIQENMQSKEA